MFARPRDLVDAFAQALNSKDAAELGELFSDDGEFVNIMGMRMRHREGIIDSHRWAFDGVGARNCAYCPWPARSSATGGPA